MRIGLFIPCYIDAFFPKVGIATLELLERFGHEVDYPRDQTCCGQPMANSGFNAECADTEALFVRNFSGFDYVVSPSGSPNGGVASPAASKPGWCSSMTSSTRTRGRPSAA